MEELNKIISGLYAKIDNQEKIIRELQEDLEDYERIFDIWNKRKLINKFNKEFSKKKVKEERVKGNKIVGAIPDAEYVYKKYYEKVEQIDKAIDFIKEHNIVGMNKEYLPRGYECCYSSELMEILKGENND